MRIDRDPTLVTPQPVMPAPVRPPAPRAPTGLLDGERRRLARGSVPPTAPAAPRPPEVRSAHVEIRVIEPPEPGVVLDGDDGWSPVEQIRLAVGTGTHTPPRRVARTGAPDRAAWLAVASLAVVAAALVAVLTLGPG